MARAKHVGKLVVSMQEAAGLKVELGCRAVTIDGEASYLITGGLGGFGLAVADRLARRGARHLVLVGRGAPSASAQAAIDSLRQQGVEVTIFLADITDHEQARRAIATAQGMAPLRGIMHAAMVLEEAPIERLTEERMWKAMAPKIVGAWNLHTLTHEVPLDFFILFSSITSVLGIPGQANYAAANAFLDMLAHYRSARGLPALSVNWGALGEAGFLARNPQIAHRLDRLGAKLMPLSQTLDALDELISSHAVQIAVAQIDWKNLSLTTGSRIPARFAAFAGSTGSDESGSIDTGARVREILQANAAALPALLENYIRDILAGAMAIADARIDSKQSLRDLGLDSLIAVELRNRVNADFGVNVPLATFIQGVTISALAQYIAERLHETARPATAACEITAAAQTIHHSGGEEPQAIYQD
jgi:acyl carrier protein